MRAPDPLVIGKMINIPKARAMAQQNKLRIVPVWVSRGKAARRNAVNPVHDGYAWVDVSDSEAPQSPTNSLSSDWSSDTEAADFREFRTPSPTDSEISWLSSVSQSSTAPTDTEPEPIDIDFDPDEDENDADTIDPDEYYVYYSDGESDNGVDGGGNGGGGGGGGDDGDDDDDGDLTPPWQGGDNWTLADQYRILGESYEDYLEH